MADEEDEIAETFRSGGGVKCTTVGVESKATSLDW